MDKELENDLQGGCNISHWEMMERPEMAAGEDSWSNRSERKCEKQKETRRNDGPDVTWSNNFRVAI